MPTWVQEEMSSSHVTAWPTAALPHRRWKQFPFCHQQDYIWRGNSDRTGGEDGRCCSRLGLWNRQAQDGLGRRQSRDACLNIFTLSNSSPPLSLSFSLSFSYPPLLPSLSKQWGLEELRAAEWTEGGRERRRMGGVLAPFLIPPKAVPTKGPPLGSRHRAAASQARLKNRVVSKRMRAKERATENKTEGERTAE